MTKARDLAGIISGQTDVPQDSLGNVPPVTPTQVSDKDNTSTGFFDVPAGTTEQRPSSPNTGFVRFNTSLDQLEQYTSDGWKGISAPPTITTTDVTVINPEDTTQTVVISGQNFDVGASAVLVGSNSVTFTPTTSTRNSSSQITITYTGNDTIPSSAAEPLSIKVTNGSGLTGLLEGYIYINSPPVFSQAANTTIATVIEDDAMSSATVLASDPDSDALTFSIVSGALPTGLTMSSGGIITGTPNEGNTGYSSSGVNHNFTVQASDGTATTDRAFTILRKWKDGSTVDQYAASAYSIHQINPSATNGWYYIRNYGTATPKLIYCDFTTQGGPWTIPWVSTTSSYFSTNGSTAISQYVTLIRGQGVGTPGRGMEYVYGSTQNHGAWLAVKRFIWDHYSGFWAGNNEGGGVLLMPVLNINGEGGSSSHRVVSNPNYTTNLPPNQDGDAANSNQLFAGRWGATDVSSWETNNFSIPAPEDWGPGNGDNTSYTASGNAYDSRTMVALVAFGIYR